MTRINTFRSIKETNSVAWGKDHAGAIIFAAVLILCSLTVGCSSDKPKPVSSNNQLPITQTPVPAPSAMLAENKLPEPKPAKKIVHKKPATVNYTDKSSGVTFEYPRRYAIETGSAATDLLESSPIPMNFVAPGGVALAAVELPETGFANTDFSSAFFNVSVHKTLTADQCNEFAVPQPKIAARLDPSPSSTEFAKSNVANTDVKSETAKNDTVKKDALKSDTVKADAAATPATSSTCHPEDRECGPKDPTSAAASTAVNKTTPTDGSKLLLGDLELRGTEAVSGEGSRQSDSKYFHVFQNEACYEFAMNVTTVASEEGITKHVNRDQVFNRLEQILSTVKINPVATQEVTAETPATTSVAATPAQ